MGSDVAYLLLYVDDIVLIASSIALLQRIITLFHNEFAMTDLGSFNYFLGISAQQTKSGLFLSQSKFVEEILERAHMQHCNPSKTPVDTESKLRSDGNPICLYMHDPHDPYFTASKHILHYVRGTIDHGIQLHVSSTSQLTAYTDADWTGCPVTRWSTSGHCVFLGDNLLSLSAKRQVTLSRSSAETEYRVVANVVAETAWLRNLLLELYVPLSTSTLIYCDNVTESEIDVPLLGPTLQMFNQSMKLTRWQINSTQSYILRTNWKTFVQENKNDLKQGATIQVWSYRKEDQNKLCLAIAVVKSAD
nr:ribonuclease H-like domain-containing protein [Tanacetum cinerariifolium]